MTTTDFEREVAYLDTVKHHNPWFEQKLTVKLTHAQVDTLIRHAYRAGVRSSSALGAAFDGAFDELFRGYKGGR